jgi:dihydroxyacetone kinase phosphoprotein-dependent L subunit
METLNTQDIHNMLLRICDVLIANEEELCKLDSYVGDGDHGITVSRGFSAVKAKINAETGMDIKYLFSMTGETLSETMGGAIGPIFGSIFSSMGEVIDASETIDTKKRSLMLREGLENVMIIGNTKPGERTLVDALSPAVESLETDAKKGTPLSEALFNAAKAAKAGAEATKNMVAKKGRAKFLQEKSLGYQDAGATSMYLICSVMAEFCGGYK